MNRKFVHTILLTALFIVNTYAEEIINNEKLNITVIADSNVKDENIQDNKFVVYQMVPRLFGNTEIINKKNGTILENGVGKFNDINDKAIEELKKLGITHIWYTGIIEHATMTDYTKEGIALDDADVVKGRAGSPYAIKDYYDVDPDLAVDVKNRMAEFEELVNRTHRKGLKAIIDFIPNHLARGYRSDNLPEGVKNFGDSDDKTKEFSPMNNFYYLKDEVFQVPTGYNPLGEEIAPLEDGKFEEKPAKATGNDVFSASPSTNDWFETIKLNYGVDVRNSGTKYFDPIPDTWTKMRDVLLFWAKKGVDGFRCDMAEMVPTEFWGWVVPQIKNYNKEIIFIGEIYNTGEYIRYINQGKFDFLYDKSGFYDRVRPLMQGSGDVDGLEFVIKDEIGISSKMLKFLENHDEQRIASKQFANNIWSAVPAMTLAATISTAPIMIYFGQESGEAGKGNEGFGGEDGRTTIFDYWGVPEHQKWVNGGKYDGGNLSVDQIKLRNFYSKLLNLVQEKEAFRKGEFYDITYANKRGQSEGWSDRKLYAFLRWHNKSKILVVVNFERKKTIETYLKIPESVFQMIGLENGKSYKTKKLLSEESGTVISSIKEEERTNPTAGNKITLSPMSVLIYEIE